MTPIMAASARRLSARGAGRRSGEVISAEAVEYLTTGAAAGALVPDAAAPALEPSGSSPAERPADALGGRG